MDTSFYFIRCKGEEKGPYAFYQIQQMRTNDELTRDKFTEEEWEQFEQFMDDGGDVPRPRNNKPAIRKIDRNEKIRKERRVLIGLTYVGYAMGGFAIIAALIQGEQDYILQSRPMFWIGLFFSAILCHTAVDGICRRQLARYPRSSGIDLFVKYLLVLALFASAIAILLGAGKYLGITAFDVDYILSTSKKYFGLGAAVSIYKPFYLGFLNEHGYLKSRGKSSILWLMTLLGWVGLLAIYLGPTSGLDHPKVAEIRDSLFTVESTVLTADGSNWKFPVHLGDTQKTVQRILGKPQISGRDYVYHSLRISFDQQQRVTRLHFDGRELRKSIFAKKLLLAGITPAGSYREMTAVLGSKNVTFGDNLSETHVWEMPGYRVAGCFWTANNPPDIANAVKWLEVSVAQ
jgi:hypothetical protein